MFIYVMDETSKETLLKKGYNLLKNDSQNSIWVFENPKPDVMEFDAGVPCVFSSVLTF
jgi:hypothetical protein